MQFRGLEQTGSTFSLSRAERQELAFCLGVREEASVAVDHSFPKYLLRNEERKLSGSWSWGQKFLFCF